MPGRSAYVLKIGHKELADAQRDPTAWVNTRLTPGNQGPRTSYAAMTREGIFHYHATSDVAAARAVVRRRLDAATRLTSLARKDEAEYKVVEYASWFEQSGLIVADFRVTIAMALGSGIAMGGQLSRVDILPQTGEYRGVLLGPVPDDWPNGDRFPLLQRAIARMYQRPESTVLLGVQDLTGDNLVDRQYTTRLMNKTEKDARKLAKEVAALVTSYRTP
jgi:hypothetical protein